MTTNLLEINFLHKHPLTRNKKVIDSQSSCSLITNISFRLVQYITANIFCHILIEIQVLLVEAKKKRMK